MIDYELSIGYCEYIVMLFKDADNERTVNSQDVKKVFEKVLHEWISDYFRSTSIWQLYLLHELESIELMNSKKKRYH